MIQTTPLELPDGRRIENIAIAAADTNRVQFRIVGNGYSVPCFMTRADFKAFRAHVERGGDPDTWFDYKPRCDKRPSPPAEDGITAQVTEPVMADIDSSEVAIDQITITDAPSQIAAAVSDPDDYQTAGE